MYNADSKFSSSSNRYQKLFNCLKLVRNTTDAGYPMQDRVDVVRVDSERYLHSLRAFVPI